MFEEERASLLPLPITHFAFFREMVRTVCDDTTVRVDSSNYAARPAAIGAKVTVRLYAHLVEIRDRQTGELLRTHARSEKPGSTVLPDEERPFNPSRQTELLWKLAREIGPHCLALCQQWFGREGRVGQRRMWGLVGLARHHPAKLVEQACAQAVQQQRATLKAITAMVVELAETAAPPPDPQLTQADTLIRDAAAYADFFAVATGGAPAGGEWLQ